MYRVTFYRDSNGKTPIDDFMDNCSKQLKSKIARQYKYLEMFGLTKANPSLRKLSGTPLWEIRILGRNSIRIVCVAIVNNIVMILNIFTKKSNKTPLNEINISLKRYKDVDNRYL